MVNQLPEIPGNTLINICWLRRDLRFNDNAALSGSLEGSVPVLLLFIFDREILDGLAGEDKRVSFIHQQLKKLNTKAKAHGSILLTMYGSPLEAFEQLTRKYQVKAVFLNRDYEPYARERDRQIEELLRKKHVDLYTFKDQVIFEKEDILKPDGKPYTVFTPYSKKWKAGFSIGMTEAFSGEYRLQNLVQIPFLELPHLEKIGFEKVPVFVPEMNVSAEAIKNYHQTRNIPAMNGTSDASVHLRFGTVSVRKLVSLAIQWNEQWLNELIWREFFMMILYHFPEVETNNFRKKYDRLNWRNNEEEFRLWCKGETGYALVDAGMRQLNQTGRMHNRVRMVTAGFLTRHLLIDWRWGEAYFAKKLLDYELSSNNGNWQWAAGTGCDSAPYFRIFNPLTQLKKFDPKLEYVRKWIPEYREDYLPRIVEHGFARERALDAYRRTLREYDL